MKQNPISTLFSYAYETCLMDSLFNSLKQMHVYWKHLSSVILVHSCVVNSGWFFNSLIFFFLFSTGDADSQRGSVIFYYFWWWEAVLKCCFFVMRLDNCYPIWAQKRPQNICTCVVLLQSSVSTFMKLEAEPSGLTKLLGSPFWILLNWHCVP
jgi:hypothetical protein